MSKYRPKKALAWACMDLQAIKAKMNNYLDNLTPEQAVKEFEKRGYKLEKISQEEINARRCKAYKYLLP